MAASVLFVLSIPLLLQNPTRPLVGANSILETERLRQYFANRPDLFAAYEKQVEAVNDLQCNDIGLMTGIDDWEYPIWVMMEASDKHFHLEHIFVNNPSGSLKTEFIPCAIVVTYPTQEQTIIYQNILFGRFNEEEQQISLFISTDP
jgi:hypothetical protein